MSEPSNIQQTISELPEPNTEAKRRSQDLCARIKSACEKQGGAISFSEYMQIALYEPGSGYYSGGLQKFGAQGDFITAPEISPLFSQCVARQCAQGLKSNALPDVLEFGAGSGVMAVELLLELERLGQLPEHYYIMELSSELKLRQRQTIQKKAPQLLDRVVWLQTLPEKKINAVVLANEVLDAMPVECFRVKDDSVETLQVVARQGELVSEYRPAGDTFIKSVRTIEQRCQVKLPDGYCSEFNPALFGWLQSLSALLHKGLVLIIDYGYPVTEYYHADRNMGTLICHYQHRAHADPLWYPGLQDITAFVDFSAIAYAGTEAGFDVSGYTSQAEFLIACGLEHLHQSKVTDDPEQQLYLAQQIKTLTLPSEMGERFKVMALCKNIDEELCGFSLHDYRNRL